MRAGRRCEITVGDGETSHGHVSSIQQAIDLLPNEGGKVCMLKGTFREHVKIDGRRNIIIEGCGALTRLEAVAASKRPLFSVRNTVGLTVRDMALRAPEGLCFAIEHVDVPGSEFGPHCRDIALQDLAIVARDAPAVFFKDGSGFRMSGCDINHQNLQAALATGQTNGLAQCILLLGRNMRVERCQISHGIDPPRAVRALGGIHVFGGSRRVEIVENEIVGGNGIGVRLGSVRFVPRAASGAIDPAYLAAPMAPIYDVDWTGQLGLVLPAGTPAGGGYRLFGTVVVKPDGCIEIVPEDDPGGGGGPPLVPVADPPIVDLLIEANRIERMGASGIAVDRFFDIEANPQMIVVVDTRILRNRIMRCAAQGCPEALRQGNLALYAAVGGIALAWAQDLVIRDNLVTECAAAFIHPICGVFVLLSEGFFAARNRIENNGARAENNEVPPDGRRGGIVLSLALAPTNIEAVLLRPRHGGA